MRTKHKIDVDGMMAWLDAQWLQYAADTDSVKAIDANAGMIETYRVTHNGKEIYKGSDIELAVRKYNAL